MRAPWEQTSCSPHWVRPQGRVGCRLHAVKARGTDACWVLVMHVMVAVMQVRVAVMQVMVAVMQVGVALMQVRP